MKDKFAEYYENNQERIEELSEYVHLNFKLIQTKMASELRRKLDITPDMENSDGYMSLVVNLYGRMFNEMVYALAGLCQSVNIKAEEIIPASTLQIFIDICKGKSPLNGNLRSDIKGDLSSFQKYYVDNIDELRSNVEALPK